MLQFFLFMIETPEDRQMFERVYLEFRQEMFRYAVSILKDEGGAEDAVHEVFLGVVKNGVERLRDVERRGKLRVYLTAAVRNQCFTILRKRGRELPLEPEAGGEEAVDQTRQISDYQDLLGMIRGMKPEYADLLYFSLVLDLSVNEIAALTGVKPSTVRKRLSRGRDLLRRTLEKEMF